MEQPNGWDLPHQQPSGHPAGWYPDPWGPTSWRWWDGWAWTVHVHQAAPAGRAAPAGPAGRAGPAGPGGRAGPRSKPRLPAWLSAWVVGFGIPAALFVVTITFSQPLSILLGLVPLAIVLPALHWLDRVEPEPLSARIHAILWGATVAVVVSAFLNSIVALSFGEAVAAVLSAPLVEEFTKGAGILYAVKRLEVDGVMDGVVYAGWIALGFAVVEDFLYLSTSAEEGFLWQTFIVRVILTPFAHPLFTFWIGLAVGIAISRSRRVMPYFLWGYGLAALTHAIWNGSLSLGSSIVLLAVVLFIILFFSVAIALIQVRRRQRIQFISLAPWIAHHYGMDPAEVVMFGNWKEMLRYRRALPRRDRRRFDEIHACLARLALLHEQPGRTDQVHEQMLVDNLHQARYGHP